MNRRKFYIHSFFSKIKAALSSFPKWHLTFILILSYSTAYHLTAQPVFADPEPYPFGLTPGGTPPWTRLVDLDHDDTLEAFVRSLTLAPPDFEPQTLDYYENRGSNEAPEFVFQASYPFGLPGPSLDHFWQFVDIDADGKDELFFITWGSDTPVKMRKNTGSLEEPNYGTEFVVNPYGIMPPLSDIDGSMLDGATPTFADMDGDGDFDLFYGGNFTNSVADEAFYYSENTDPTCDNEDPSDDGTNPQFALPIKNPFGLTFPEGLNAFHQEIFADTDCDGDLDMYMGYPPGQGLYFENTGTPTNPDFSTLPNNITLQANFGSFVDIGGDGDLDFVSGPSFFENISPPFPEPEAGFDFVQDGLTLNFTDTSSEFVTKWIWDFGDSTSSEEQHPVHTYAEGGTYEVCLTAWTPCKSHEICQVIQIMTGTRESRLKADFQLFPNPSGDLLQVELKSEEPLKSPEIVLFNLLGAPVRHWNFPQNNIAIRERLNLSGLSAGIYVLKVQANDQFLARKFVKR